MGKIYSYRLKFYLNATHAMRWSDQIGEEHPHTWGNHLPSYEERAKSFY